MSKATFNLTGLGMTLQKPVDLKEPTENEETYTLNELDSSAPSYKEIAVDFNNAGLKIQKIEQLQNHLLWHRYNAEKKSILGRKHQDPAFQLNEKYLYHGTTAKKDYICNEGLDSRLSGKKCRFGPGVYFSDNPLKCAKYAEKGSTSQFIVVARVILGCPKIYPPGKRDPLLKREPEKEQPFKGWRFYDSVEGCPKDYKEFVIYRNDKALIEYIITYSKDSKSTTSSSSFPRYNSLSTSASSSSKPTGRFTTDETDDSSGTSDEDEKASAAKSSDSDTDGYSTDSSQDEDQTLPAKHRNEISSAKTMVPKSREIRAEDILAEKKKEFTRKTGENRQHVIESFLSTTGLNVDKAVALFMDKDRKMKDKEREQKELEMKQKKESASKKRVIRTHTDAACDLVTPASEPDKWKQLAAEDKNAIVDALTDNLILVIGLENNVENRTLSRKILFSCDCDLDRSILAYYESL